MGRVVTNVKINEIFKSIQGESSYIGFPCVFIRLSGCNLRCSYCDTKYAYDDGESFSLDDVFAKVDSFGCKFVAVTGGEPLLQPATLELIEQLCKKGYKVLVETNGTVSIKDVCKHAVVVMDIKCPSSRVEEPFLQENLNYLKLQDEVKFVISDKQDYVWAKERIDEFDLAAKTEKIIMSPNMDVLEPKVLAEWILEDNLSVRFQVQLHKILGVK